MEEKSNGKGKLTPSLPPNYISIIQLRERWNNEKNRKQKEEEAERRRKQEIEEQRRIEEEEDLKKREQEKRRNSKKKESVVILSERGDCEVPRDDGVGEPKKKRNKGKFRKRYDSRKKRNHGVEENVVDERGLTVTEIDIPVKDGSIAMPVYVVKESNAPVIQVYGEEGGGGGEEAKGNGPREKPVAIETRIDDSVPRDEGLGKKKTRSYRRKKDSQDVAVEEDVVECGMENKTLVKDVVTFYREKAKGKEPREKSVAVETQSEDLVPRDEGLGKKKKKKKKKNKYVVAVGECESMVTEKKTPVIGVYRDKRVYKEAKGDGPCEGAVTAIEAQFGNLSIQREETKDLKEQTRSGKFGKHRKKTIQDVVHVEETPVQCEATVRAKKTPVKGVIQVYENLCVKTKDLKAETRSSNRNQPNQRRDLHSQRVGMDAATMVWVKKGQKERDDAIGSNVKTLSA